MIFPNEVPIINKDSIIAMSIIYSFKSILKIYSGLVILK